MDRKKIEMYVQGGAELLRAFWGLTHEQLHAKPADGSWTLHQNAIHMMDSEMIGIDRMKRIICMDNPLLCNYDETAFNLIPGQDQLSAFTACELFKKNRDMMAIILRAIPDSFYARTGIHSEAGKMTLEDMVDKYVNHLAGHLVSIHRKRKLLEQTPTTATSLEPT
jgi:hypothetical protein